MKVLMKSYMTGPKNSFDLSPGDIHEFDETEGQRLIDVGGARLPTGEELAALAEREAKSNLANMSVKELVQLASDRGVSLGDATKKPDIIALLEQASQPQKSDGPTVAEWVKAGYKAVNYPPTGYVSKSTQEEIDAAIAAQAS